MSNIIIVKTNDGRIHELPINVAEKCTLITNIINDMRDIDGALDTIPLSNLDSQIYLLVVELTGHVLEAQDSKTSPSKTFFEKIKALDLEKLNGLLSACDYLCNELLLDKTCEAIAQSLNNKTPDEIREMFGLEDDLTPEEKENIKQKYKWVLES